MRVHHRYLSPPPAPGRTMHEGLDLTFLLQLRGTCGCGLLPLVTPVPYWGPALMQHLHAYSPACSGPNKIKVRPQSAPNQSSRPSSAVQRHC